MSRSDAAQQLSASAWLTEWLEGTSRDADLCIGQSPSVQHAMRASGEGIQPAQMAGFPAAKASMTNTAEKRLLKVSTLLRMLERRGSVNVV